MIENDQVKLMRDHRPDITLALKDKQQWIMIDVAVPDDPEAGKIERYQELAFAPGRSYSGATGHSGSRNSLRHKILRNGRNTWISLILLEAPRCRPCWQQRISFDRYYISELPEGAKI